MNARIQCIPFPRLILPTSPTSGIVLKLLWFSASMQIVLQVYFSGLGAGDTTSAEMPYAVLAAAVACQACEDEGEEDEEG
jgi:hypothetical protein